MPRIQHCIVQYCTDCFLFRCAQSPLKYHLIFSESRVAKLIALVWLLAFAIGFSVFYVPSAAYDNSHPQEEFGDEHYEYTVLSRFPPAQPRETHSRQLWTGFAFNASGGGGNNASGGHYRIARHPSPVEQLPLSAAALPLHSSRTNFSTIAHNGSFPNGRRSAPKGVRRAQSTKQAAPKPPSLPVTQYISKKLQEYCNDCNLKVYDSMYAVLVLLIICSLLLIFIYSAIFYRIKQLQSMQEATVRYVTRLRSTEGDVTFEKNNGKHIAGTFTNDRRRPERVSLPQGMKPHASRIRSLDNAQVCGGSSHKLSEAPTQGSQANLIAGGSDTVIVARAGKRSTTSTGTDPGLGPKPVDEAGGGVVFAHRRPDSRYYSRRYRRGLATTLLLLCVFLFCFIPYFVLELYFTLIFHLFLNEINSAGPESNQQGGFFSVYPRLIFYFYDLLVLSCLIHYKVPDFCKNVSVFESPEAEIGLMQQLVARARTTRFRTH